MNHAEHGELWSHRAAIVARFCAEHSRLPDRLATAALERDAGLWFERNIYLHSRGRLDTWQEEMLDTYIPDWRSAQSTLAVGLSPRDARWFTALQEVAQYVATTGLSPRSNAHDPQERIAGAWIRRQRNSRTVGELSAVRISLLDEHLPVWSTTRRSQKWQEHAQALQNFVLENGRLPRTYIDGDDAELAAWAYSQYRRASSDPSFSKGRTLVQSIADLTTDAPHIILK